MAKKFPADGKKNHISKLIVFANSNFGIILKTTSGFWSVLHIHVYFECFSLPISRLPNIRIVPKQSIRQVKIQVRFFGLLGEKNICKIFFQFLISDLFVYSEVQSMYYLPQRHRNDLRKKSLPTPHTQQKSWNLVQKPFIKVKSTV